MEIKYQDLGQLIADDPSAQLYYDSLPAYVRDQITARADSVNSLESLQDYAENLLRGDG